MTTAAMLADVWRVLGGDPVLLDLVEFTGPPGTLPSRLPVTALAQASVAAAGLAAADLTAARTGGAVPPVRVDSRAVAVAFTSERHLRIDGEPPSLWDPLSRFLPAADGWVRLHGNYPHHRARLFAALGVDPDGPDPVAAVAGRVAGMPALAVEDAVTRIGGIAAAVREPAAWAAHPQGVAAAAAPLPALRRVGDAPVRRMPPPPADPLLPAAGVRVLDLTRVIAGPVATRTLALFGADVLRIDPPGLPEITAQHLDTGFGKRSALLDLAVPADRARFAELLEAADVVVSGYRPGALDRYGLSAAVLAARRPGLVLAAHGAWGPTGPWALRRGFDSIVQAACGIARVEAGDAARPAAMPAQALDHATGYLIAASVLRALADQARAGGTWHATLSLAGTAAWLLGAAPTGAAGAGTADPGAADPGAADPGAADAGAGGGGGFEPGPYLATARVGAVTLTHALPPVRLDGGPVDWAHPPVPWGGSPAAWLPETSPHRWS